MPFFIFRIINILNYNQQRSVTEKNGPPEEIYLFCITFFTCASTITSTLFYAIMTDTSPLFVPYHAKISTKSVATTASRGYYKDFLTACYHVAS